MATTTANLGLTKPDYTEAADIAVINNNMDLIDSAIAYRSRVWNLLDNSNFTNPVNQRGKTSYAGAGYAIDRWRAWVDSNTLTIHDGYITTTGDYAQYIKGLGKGTYSAFAMRTDGTLIQINTGYESANDWRYVSLPAGSYVWAALYEGEYTAETLPAYVPRGYAAELSECRRYFRRKETAIVPTYVGANQSSLVFIIENDEPFRAIPNMNLEAISWIRGEGKNITTIPSWTVSHYTTNNVNPSFSVEFGSSLGLSIYGAAFVYCTYSLDAEL